MNKDKILSLLGLSYRANKVIIGSDEVIDSIKNTRLQLVFLAQNFSSVAERRIRNDATFHKIDIIDSFTEDEISKALGKTHIKALGISDEGLSSLIKEAVK